MDSDTHQVERLTTMKDIDTKSLIIGVLLASTIFLGVAAVPKDTGDVVISLSEWDDKQEWTIKTTAYNKRSGSDPDFAGYEPFGKSGTLYLWRKRLK